MALMFDMKKLFLPDIWTKITYFQKCNDISIIIILVIIIQSNCKHDLIVEAHMLQLKLLPPHQGALFHHRPIPEPSQHITRDRF